MSEVAWYPHVRLCAPLPLGVGVSRASAQIPGSVQRYRGFTFQPSDVESTLSQPDVGAIQRSGAYLPRTGSRNPARPRGRVARSAGDGPRFRPGVLRVPTHETCVDKCAQMLALVDARPADRGNNEDQSDCHSRWRRHRPSRMFEQRHVKLHNEGDASHGGN